MFLRKPIAFTVALLMVHRSAFAAVPTPSLMGPLGLNTVPSARMDDSGTARATFSGLDPFVHASLGLQIAMPLYIGLRQTSEISSFRDGSRGLFPGADLKLRLRAEGSHVPAIAMGLQSAFGDHQLSGEYLVFSKRRGDFDFTGGIGWGRSGSSMKLPNPLGLLGHHFRQDRPPETLDSAGPSGWFTGKTVGLFGGVEYFPPFFDRLSFKADWGGGGYRAERAAFDFNPSKPWSIGVAYRARRWLTLGAALVGGSKILAMLSMRNSLKTWPRRKQTTKPLPAHIVREEDAVRTAAIVDVNDDASLAKEAGQAARQVASTASASEIDIVPRRYGLTGPIIELSAAEIQDAENHNGSPQEIWRVSSIDKGKTHTFLYRRFHTDFHLVLDNQMSMDSSGVLLSRSSIVGSATETLGNHFLIGGALRVNTSDDIVPAQPSSNDIRGDVWRFAGTRVETGRLYGAWLASPTKDFHLKIDAGMLEEMFGGVGSEILWRPFGKTYALGAEAWSLWKRDPDHADAIAFEGSRTFSGFLNSYYEFPNSNLTLEAGIGRYLAGDLGGTVALAKHMDDGIAIKADLTITNRADTDTFGHMSHIYTGFTITVPLDYKRHIPRGAQGRLRIAPLTRDSGATVDDPLPLYDLTDPFSARQIVRHWNEITD